METKSIKWNTGTGNITLTYGGQGDGTISVQSDDNNLFEQRSQTITVKTTAGSPQQTKTVTIVQAARQQIDISTAVVTAANQTYSGSALTPVPTVTLGGETVPSTGYDVTYSNNTNAGTATVTITGKGDYTGSASGNFTINKAAPTYTAPTAKSLTYNTGSQELLNAGSTSHGAIQYSSDNSTWGTTIPSQTNAGSYTVYWRLVGDANHTDVSSTSISASISAKTVSSPTITLSQSSYTYSGSACQPTATVKDGSTTISSSEYTVSYSNNTNAGTATVTITDNSGGNYTVSGSTTFTINKANPTYTAPTARSLTYTGGQQYLVTAGSTSHGTIYYSSDNSTWSTTRPRQLSAGTYTTYWKLTGDANHNDVASKSISTTIAKANSSLTAAPTKKTLTYTGSAQELVNAGTASGGTVYYKCTTSNSKPTSTSGFSSSIPTQTNAGNYYVWYYVKGDSNHNDTAINSTSVTPTIAKASRTISFSDVYNVVAPSGTITKTAIPSAGSGDGAITYSISSTTYATINSSSGKVTAKTSEGSATVTATIAAGTNYNSASATYTLYVFATTHNFDYTGSVQSLLLPPGSYTLQCWGAQGGSNAADSSYEITAQAGGKGGYSTGVLSISEAETVYAFVGGQGDSSGNGGWNGGGGGTGSTALNNETYGDGKTCMGCGGGATDIALTTSSMTYSNYRNNRSSASLLSRMIVAGGGSGGASGTNYKTTTAVSWDSWGSISGGPSQVISGNTYYRSINDDCGLTKGKTYRITNLSATNTAGIVDPSQATIYLFGRSASNVWQSQVAIEINTEFTVPTSSDHYALSFMFPGNVYVSACTVSATVEEKKTSSSTYVDAHADKAGYVGGGTSGGGYSNTYKGRQNAAGTNGTFGFGANQQTTVDRYHGGLGGGGWYGGGLTYSSSTYSDINKSGGGSGFVNTSANASYRPSGYTGLQLDSGSTYAGSSTFVAPGGGNETGHTGNGYARITRN